MYIQVRIWISEFKRKKRFAKIERNIQLPHSEKKLNCLCDFKMKIICKQLRRNGSVKMCRYDAACLCILNINYISYEISFLNMAIEQDTTEVVL